MARTISISLVPMPNASAPKAPCVAVWESPQTMVMPGCVSPSSGPMTWTMPRVAEPWPWNGIPNSRQFSSIWRSCLTASSSAIGIDGSSVGIEWSAVATVWPGFRTFRPRSRRPVNACGLVTS